MRKLHGVIVPDWFIANRRPFEGREVPKFIQMTIGTHAFEENKNVTVQEILDLIPKDHPLDCVEIDVNNCSYDGDTEISIEWFERLDNPNYEKDTEMQLTQTQCALVWDGLKRMIDENIVKGIKQDAE